MMNYYKFIGHYKNIVSQKLCNAIIEEDFDYSKSTYSTHKGISPKTEKRISQQKLAENLGVSRQTINSIEKGRFDPSLKLTIKIVRFFDKDLESIFKID